MDTPQQPAPMPQPQPQEPQQPEASTSAPVVSAPAPAPALVQPAAPVSPTAPVEAAFSSSDTVAAPQQIDPSEAVITWSAKEYIHPDKTPIWYFLFGFIALGFIALDLLLLKSWTFSALVIVMSVAIMVYIRRPARTLTYALSAEGLYVGEQLYPFDDFKSFGLIDADGSNSIMLVPRKRFSPGVSVYFPTEAGEQIVDILGNRLPMEELKLDLVDIVVRKLRL